MKKSILLASAAVFIAASTPALAKQEVYDIDPSHTAIQFSISHVGFSKMLGKFEKYTADIKLDEEKPENSQVSITIDPKSVKTSSEALDEHLQKPDFFNSEKFDNITFKSTGVKKVSDKEYKLTGDFTLLGVTKPLTLDVTFNKAGDFYGQKRAGFSMQGKLKRSDFGMNYGLENVGDEVGLTIETEAVKHTVTPPKKKN